MVAQAGSSKILPVSSEFDNYSVDLQSSALLATKASTLLPPDIPFHRSVDNGFGKLIDSTSEKALGLTNRLLSLVSSSTKTSGSRGKGKLRLEDQADVADRFESLVVDALDQLLENADICLDEFLGRNKSHPTASTTGPLASKKTSKDRSRLEYSLTHAAHIPKPQINFRQPFNNHSLWSPTLKHKYNAQVPMGYNFMEGDEEMDVDSTPLR